MSSIYREVLGGEFDRLHPKLQWRFGLSSADETCQIGAGVMDEVWRGPWWTLPFLLLGSTRRVLFPSRGRSVPFTIANYAYVDRFGRETVTWSRRFKFARRDRSFDATMIHSKGRDTIVDYLGTHQHLAVDLDLRVDEQGAMCIRSGEQRFYEGRIALRFPLLFSGLANVREWWDEDAECFGVDVHVANKLLGPLFGYRGRFTVTEHACTDADIPIDVRPLREEDRD
jgi:hypothetical protein